jgi:hypothetical protein
VIVSPAGFSTTALHIACTKGLALVQIPENANRLDDAIGEDVAAIGFVKQLIRQPDSADVVILRP